MIIDGGTGVRNYKKRLKGRTRESVRHPGSKASFRNGAAKIRSSPQFGVGGGGVKMGGIKGSGLPLQTHVWWLVLPLDLVCMTKKPANTLRI